MKTLLRRRGDQLKLGRGIDIIILDVSERTVKLSLPLSADSAPALATQPGLNRHRTDYVRYMSGVGHRLILVRQVGEVLSVGDAELCVIDVTDTAAKLGVRKLASAKTRVDKSSVERVA